MIKFKCFVPEVANTFPILKAKEIKHDWVNKAFSYFQSGTHNFNTTRCPGIFSIMNTGWIQTSYQNIMIDTTKENIQWYTEINQSANKNGEVIGDYIHYHSEEQLSQFYSDWKIKQKTILKIQSPWFVEIPKGYALLSMPVPYNDDQRFMSAVGLLRGNNFLNVQLYWNVDNEKTIVSSGTPLQQYILVKDIDNSYGIESIEDAVAYLKDVGYYK